MRKCKKCGRERDDDAFEVINHARGWRRGECKECVKHRVRRYAVDSKRAIARKEYYLANREEIIGKVGQWVKANPDRRRKNALAYYYRLQNEAILAYGGYRCSWCGIDEPLVLCLDHVANNGRDHRREIGSLGGHKLYKWLRDNNYPPGFQVLCMNCNHAKYRNGGELVASLKGRCNDHPFGE